MRRHLAPVLEHAVGEEPLVAADEPWRAQAGGESAWVRGRL